MLGFGSVGQGLLPVLLGSFDLTPERIRIVKTRPDASGVAAALGVEVIVQALDQGNHETVLESLLTEGDFLVNLSVDVASLALMRFCGQPGVLYSDACIEPWPGRYDNPELPPSQRSNHALREEVLAWRRGRRQGPTACVAQGANPGLVSFLLKTALLNMAADRQLQVEPPAAREDWAAPARKLEVKVIHIAERDSQLAPVRRQRAEFVNTWSVDGFVDEGLQPSELRKEPGLIETSHDEATVTRPPPQPTWPSASGPTSAWSVAATPACRRCWSWPGPASAWRCWRRCESAGARPGATAAR